MPAFRLATFAVLLFAPTMSAADWPQFRGPNATGVADDVPLPDKIGPENNVIWKVETPPGHSSPIVVGERIYLTAIRDKKLVTIALNRADGHTLWERESPYRKLETIHNIGSHAQPSPAADKQVVVSFFGSSGLFGYNSDGKLLWHKPMGPFPNEYGAGSSPILVGERVILSQDHDNSSFLMSLDKKSGEIRRRSLDRARHLADHQHDAGRRVRQCALPRRLGAGGRRGRAYRRRAVCRHARQI